MNKTYQRINWQNEPSIATPLNEVNLNKVDYSLNEVDNRVISLDTSKANQSDLLQTIKTLTYNTETGVFTFTFWNGSTYTVDLNIEKIPVDFSMDEYGVITMTTADGTEYTCDISELIKLYTFVDSSEIDFTVTTDASGNKTITAGIKEGSIVGSKLQPNFLADCQTAKNQAESAAGSASSSATSSELSSEDSEAWAVGERNGQPVPSTDPAYENNAKWWAQHGTGSSFAGLSDTNFTNLQDGQIAKYDSQSGMWINTEDEGGLLPHFKITSEAGSTVTVVCPDTSVIVPTQTSSGIWQCDVPAYGVYTVHAVINGDDAVRTVTVDTVKEYVIHDEHYSYTLNVYAPTGSSIIVTDGGSETYTGTGAGSTAVIFALHQASTLYHITVTYDGLDIDTTITSSATSGQSGSKTITFGTINLTVDEDLIGETIVMAKGTDTVSKVASSTSMVFYPNATGNWRISAEYEGETVYAEPDPIVVSSLSTPVSAELSLVKIPEGATVTPTDDIQTWLACANITDKSYTTLAEALADRETFETLIADSNACDYMARSTTWAGITGGIVPAMTSTTQPSGEVNAESQYSNDYADWKAFNGSVSNNGWLPNSSATVGNTWIQYEFPSAKIVNCLGILQYWSTSSYSYTKKITVKIEGSNNGTDFIQLASNLESTYSWNEWAYCNFNNSSAYKLYRITITGVESTTSSISLTSGSGTKLQLYQTGITTSQDAMALIGKYDYCSNALLSNATWAEAIANSDYTFINPKVPNMTSATAPSGEVISSTTQSGREAYHSFAGANTGSFTVLSTANNAYIGYKFTEKVNVVGFFLHYMSTTSPMPTMQLQCSNTGVDDWVNVGEPIQMTTADQGTAQTDVPSLDHIVSQAEDEGYEYWRLLFSTSASGDLQLFRVQFYGRASSNVSNTNGIIHTAMGNDSVYCVETGDTFTATDGIATVDFSDFDEGVYTFGSTTAKNPSDLSQDYTKQFRITKSPYGGTTELYLMPDAVKTLYWWGYVSDNLQNCTSANGWSVQTYSMVAPTYNTSNISMETSSNQLKGVGTASKVNLSSVKAIATGVTISSSVYVVEAIATAKDINNLINYNYLNSDSITLVTLDASTSGEYNVTFYVTAGRNSTLHALWYE